MKVTARSVSPASQAFGPGFGSPIGGLRIALYSHDTVGLGHMRRNLLIAQSLSAPPLAANILMIAGAAEASVYPRPARVDCLTLPALSKQRGAYQSRSLGLTLHELRQLRAETICAAVEAFEPDVLIVDKVPRGAVQELNPTLEYVRKNLDTTCILGLRDVLDEPASVRREWESLRNEAAILDYYDSIWVYGDPEVYDVVGEYGLSPAVAEKVRYTGYLDRRRRRTPHEAEESAHRYQACAAPGPFALCTVGGGQDGARLAEAFTRIEFPAGRYGVLLTGPFMPVEARRALYRRAARNPAVRVVDFVNDPTEFLRRADRVIAMGGYNTVSELISYEKRSLIVPRVTPRQEQWIRAERLREMGMLDVCHPDDATPQALEEWLAREVVKPSRDRIDLGGLTRLPELLQDVTASCKPVERLVGA
jgi:predicted glycosyltransferase